MKFKDGIKELDLKDNDTIFVSIYNKSKSRQVELVKNIDKSLLKRDVKVIQKNYGGQKYGYGCYHFILK